MVEAFPMSATQEATPDLPPALPFLVLAGPTAGGKTGVALELARRWPERRVEIVNGDAFQAYRGLEILAATPTQEERSRVPHHLFACADPGEERDAVRHAREAHAVIRDIAARGGTPLVVGGSGLYLRAITHGLAPTPPGDEALRAALEPLPLEALSAWLERIDPEAAASTNLKNRRYVTRNLEIVLLGGVRLSELRAGWERDAARASRHATGWLLVRGREELHRRIEARVEAMFAQGVVDEVARVEARLSRTAAKAIGVQEIRALLRGGMTEAACREAMVTATRQYAKRQMTWFRREGWLKEIPLEARPPAEMPFPEGAAPFPWGD